MRRIVEPELLDDLPADDPRAVGSRRDLRRLNFIMGHAGILTRAFREHRGNHSLLSKPLRVVELGAGNGTLCLELARRWAARGAAAHITLLDRQNLVSTETQRAFTALNWSSETVTSDVFVWLEQCPSPADVMFTNLFLHHFNDDAVRALLRLTAERTNLFIACEPRRAALVLTLSRLLWLIGGHAVTRHDAVVSVRAGFAGKELSALWSAGDDWDVSEGPAGFFSHCFVAKRHD